MLKPTTGHGVAAACGAALLITVAACDIPSEAPDFSVNPTIKTPIVFSDGLLFLGPGPAGEPSIIDTTSPDFDSLFSVNPTDRSVYVVRELERIQLDQETDLFDPRDVGPEDLAVVVDELESGVYTSSAARTVGLQEGAPRSSPPLPRMMDGGEVFVPGRIDSLLSDPGSDLLTLSTSSIEAFGFSSDAAPYNLLTISLTNRSGHTLTDGTFAGASVPAVDLVDASGDVLARAVFDHAPADNETASAVFSLAGRTIPADARLRLDVGTTSGLAPIENDPTSLVIVGEASTTRYESFVFDSVSPQTDVQIVEEAALTGSSDFSGVVVSSGQIELTVTNDLPIPFVLETLRLENVAAFGPYAADHVFASTAGGNIPAHGSAVFVLPISNEGISAATRVVAVLNSPGTATEATIAAGQGLFIDAVADLTVDEVFLTDLSEDYASAGSFQFEVPDIQFGQPDDFVELSSGTLAVEDLINGYGVSFDEVVLSFPDILFPPYGPQDSLVVTFGALGADSGPHAHYVDLADARLRAPGGEIRYSVSAGVNATGSEQSIAAGDSIRASVTARDIVPRALEASMDPISVSLTNDTNGDGMLDVLSDQEAEVVAIDGLQEFYDFGLTGLSIVGAELALDITTSIGADIELVGTLVGVRQSGETVYLEGRSQNAVAPTDSLAGKFSAGGLPLDPQQLVRMQFTGDPGKVVERRIVFNDANSNVGEFVANLPEEVRMVAQAVIGRENGRVTLSDPFTLSADVSLTLPMYLRGELSLTHDMAADMSALEQLTDPTTSVEVEVAEVSLEYDNFIPVGVGVVLHFLDEYGQETIALPAAGDPVARFDAAPSGDDGFGTGSSTGRAVFPLDEERLRALARSRTVSMELSVDTGTNGLGRIRADDRVTFALSGNFDILVHIGR